MEDKDKPTTTEPVVTEEGDNVVILVDADVEEDTPAAPEAGKDDKSKTEVEEDPEKTKLISEITNLGKATKEELRAIKQAQLTQLQEARQNRKAQRQEQTKRLDRDDETVQVWSAEIEDKVAPVNETIELNKHEIFEDAFLTFAESHPMSKQMAERVLATYQSIATSSGLNTKAVMRDIARAYAAESVDDQEAVTTKATESATLAEKASVAITKGNGGGGSGAGGKKLVIPKEEYEILKRAGMSDEKIAQHYKAKQ